MPPTREICKVCFKVNPVGFDVPDDIWEAVVPTQYRSRNLCLMCFCEMADGQGVQWDRDITFHPVSLVSHETPVKDPTNA